MGLHKRYWISCDICGKNMISQERIVEGLFSRQVVFCASSLKALSAEMATQGWEQLWDASISLPEMIAICDSTKCEKAVCPECQKKKASQSDENNIRCEYCRKQMLVNTRADGNFYINECECRKPHDPKCLRCGEYLGKFRRDDEVRYRYQPCECVIK